MASASTAQIIHGEPTAYDFLVMEYTGTEPAWVQANAVDWQFLKRYRDGYHLWVPENLPSPHADEPGHEVWTDVPEDGDAGLRGFYCLKSDWGAQEGTSIRRSKEAPVDRAGDSRLPPRLSIISGTYSLSLTPFLRIPP